MIYHRGIHSRLLSQLLCNVLRVQSLHLLVISFNFVLNLEFPNVNRVLVPNVLVTFDMVNLSPDILLTVFIHLVKLEISVMSRAY